MMFHPITLLRKRFASFIYESRGALQVLVVGWGSERYLVFGSPKVRSPAQLARQDPFGQGWQGQVQT